MWAITHKSKGEAEKMTKKEQSLSLFDEGVRDVEAIAERIGANPTYIANTLIGSGRSIDYSDLYTSSRPRNRYGDDFNGILRFKDMDATRECVRQLNVRYQFYRETGDRQGQYQARSIALMGYERAMGLGKVREAQLFADWLTQTLQHEVMSRVEQVEGSDSPEA
jgi:hypothetical protein